MDHPPSATFADHPASEPPLDPAAPDPAAPDPAAPNPAAPAPDDPDPDALVTLDAATCLALAERLLNDGRPAEAEPFWRALLSVASDRADLWANLGLAILRAGRPDEAVACQREALRLDPDHVEAMNNLGIAMHRLTALAEAENHFRGVLRLAPDHARATLNLGVVRQCLGDPREAETCYRRARALGAEPGQVCNNLALALAEQGRLAEAETACRDALLASPDFHEAKVNLALILLMLGRMTEAWPLYEARWNIPPLAEQGQPSAGTRWTGAEPLDGRTILLIAEQGFGDALQFCRYAPLLAERGAAVILVVPSPLNRLLRTLAGVGQVVSEDDPLPPSDLYCPLLSLPLAFGTTERTIPRHVPYLAADPDLAASWSDRLAAVGGPGRCRVGLVWAGARRVAQPNAAAIDKRRSMRLADMAPLGTVAGCAFVSLQLGPPAREAAEPPFPLLNVADRLTDFAETAALIEALDLVISVDTAVVHLAGALGKPVWLLNRFDSCWRWPRDREVCAWYPSLRLFHQARPGDWSGVLWRVTAALAGFMSARE